MIYFAQDTVSLNIKIGYTGNNDAEKRIRQLQTGNSNRIELVATTPGEQADESRLHQTFAALNVCGEWFRPGPSLLKFLGDVRQQTQIAPSRHALDFSRPLSFYLAGKIEWGWNWRQSIVPYESMESADPSASDWPVLKGVIHNTHHYVGPYYIHWGHGQTDGGDDEHGLGIKKDSVRPEVVRKCLDAIRRADVLFAWVDSLDCYGTIAEIGYALALKKQVWIAGPRHYRDMWFLYQAATICETAPLSPAGAFDSFLRMHGAKSCGCGDSGGCDECSPPLDHHVHCACDDCRSYAFEHGQSGA